MFYVYVLRSESDSGFYIGFSTNLRARLRQHQDGESLATSHRGPWKLIYYEAYTEREDAEGREKFLKSGAGRRLKLGRFPHSLAASLAALPSMSLIPFAPFTGIPARRIHFALGLYDLCRGFPARSIR